MRTKEDKVFAAMYEELDSGHIWIPIGTIDNYGSLSRRIAKVSFGEKSIHCEVLELDPGYCKKYSEPGSGRLLIADETENIVVINDWYRRKLGIDQTYKDSMVEVALDIRLSAACFSGLLACFDHPQVIVRIATWLGLLGATLGLIGIIPTICSVIRWIFS